jgi:hypothetical protein
MVLHANAHYGMIVNVLERSDQGRMQSTLDGVRLGQYEICLSTITTVCYLVSLFSNLSIS